MGGPPDLMRYQAAEPSAQRPRLRVARSAPAGDPSLPDMLKEIDRLRAETERLRGRIIELESLADADPLLPLFNRRAFARELARAISLAERYGEPLSVAFFDLNGFKQINDKHGHASGDAVLVHVAEILRANVRDSDIVGRLGGDEFGVILLRSDLAHARVKARQLADIIRTTPADAEGTRHSVGAAWGACACKPGESAAELLDRADAAMYAEKSGSKR